MMLLHYSTIFVDKINALKGKINSSFASALTMYHNLDYLDDIRESVVENKRVLAVKAMYRTQG